MKSTIIVAAALAGLANATPDRTHPLKHTAVFRRGNPQGVEQSAVPAVLNSQTVQGCYSSSGDLTYNTTQTWNSIGSCAHDICYEGGFTVGGSTGGNQCWCGNTYPALDTLVKDSECNAPCTGFGDQACGGDSTWTIYNTGLSISVKHQPNTTNSQSSSSSSAPATAVVTMGQQTVVVTQSAAAESSDTSSSGSSSGGSNVGGIVAGVVVGVVVVASAVGGVFLYMRRRRNQELEEEYRRNATVNDFFGKPPGSSGGMSATDSRLDPVMAQRRMSDGSIADNQDYSRRILRVTNA